MKTTTSLLLAAAIALMGITANAQDKQIANHVALGVTLGLDGVGLEAALTMTPYVQFRGGYSLFPYTYKGNFDLGHAEMGGTTRDLSNTPISATLWKGGEGKILADIFPGKNTGFHFTVGAYIGAGKIFHASADLSKAISPSEYATMAITYGEGADKLSISTDQKGFINADIKTGGFTPYVGIGFGRAIKPDSRVRVTFDMGVLITGGIKLQSYSYLRNEKGDPAVITSKYLVDNDGRQLDDGWVDKICAFPVYPMMKLNIFVRLF
jgi:opacity protein-like surface antigen